MYTTITIDSEELRQDMFADSRAAFYGGGFGGALYESFEIERAIPQKLVEMAQRKRIDLIRYAHD